MDLAILTPIVGFVAMLIVGIIAKFLEKEEKGTEKMQEIASYIQEGAMAFLKREYKTMSLFIIVLALLLYFFLGWEITLGFIIGTFFSLLAAWIGMNIAVRANVRVANAARKSAGKAAKIAFYGGSVTGLSIVGLSLIGIGLLFFLFGKDPALLVGFGFGASLAALFAQLGGGIYTKGADVGADLVGKVEKHIPEDDPRNPAVIADLVGDNVGDCAGRGADLFESFSDNIIGTMILGTAFYLMYGLKGIIFPLLVGTLGVIATIIGIFSVRDWKDPIKSIFKSFGITALICLIGFYFLTVKFLNNINFFYCALLGLFSSIFIALIVQYYTGARNKVVKEIAKASEKGTSINLITGFSYGLESAVWPLLLIAIVITVSYFICGKGMEGIYGIAVAAMGILSTTGIIMTSDTFGPICDNAGGIVEFSGISEEVRERTEILDAAGNVTKAITKGYAMGCAALTAVSLFFAYIFEASKILGINFSSINDVVINLVNPTVIVPMFIGGALPFLFSALSIRAVGKTAFEMVKEVKRQFKEIPGLMEGTAKPNYSKCVDISTKNALKEMTLPTLIALIVPIIVGFVFGIWGLGAYLISVTIVSVLLAVFMYNAGGAWDNAKKYIEAGHFGGKGTPAHAAAVIGDTFGDPLKDTAGPSLHILIKLQNIVAITLLSLFILYSLL